MGSTREVKLTLPAELVDEAVAIAGKQLEVILETALHDLVARHKAALQAEEDAQHAGEQLRAFRGKIKFPMTAEELRY